MKILIFLLVMAIGWIYESAKARMTKHRADNARRAQSAPVQVRVPVREPEVALKPAPKPRLRTEYTPLQSMPEEGERITEAAPQTGYADATAPQADAAADSVSSAHYARWRRAVIDSQILLTKF